MNKTALLERIEELKESKNNLMLAQDIIISGLNDRFNALVMSHVKVAELKYKFSTSLQFDHHLVPKKEGIGYNRLRRVRADVKIKPQTDYDVHFEIEYIETVGIYASIGGIPCGHVEPIQRKMMNLKIKLLGRMLDCPNFELKMDALLIEADDLYKAQKKVSQIAQEIKDIQDDIKDFEWQAKINEFNAQLQVGLPMYMENSYPLIGSYGKMNMTVEKITDKSLFVTTDRHYGEKRYKLVQIRNLYAQGLITIVDKEI